MAKPKLWTLYSLIFVVIIVCEGQEHSKQRIDADDQKQLYFLLMVSSAAGVNTSGVVQSVESALLDINSDPITLPGRSLHYTRVVDTKVLRQFNAHIISNKIILSV